MDLAPNNIHERTRDKKSTVETWLHVGRADDRDDIGGHFDHSGIAQFAERP